MMLTLALAAAVIAMFITPPSKDLLSGIDWRTLGTLFMMLTVLEGFKQENIFLPFIRFANRFVTMPGLSFFLICCVFFSSMFVTNDVSLIIFVPLTIILFRAGNKERYILPVISMENIAAIRGSLLTPFGSPQNLFLYGRSGVSAPVFMLHMSPLWVTSFILLFVFVKVLYRKDPKMAVYESAAAAPSYGKGGSESVNTAPGSDSWDPARKHQRIIYLCLFVLIVATIVSRTPYWYVSALIVLAAVLISDRRILLKTDYVLLGTFLCFFIFSSSIAANAKIAGFLTDSVAENEYWWSILLSQVISNVPASIVLWPFTKNLAALLYGLDSAGLCSLIGSLASVINYRIYVREYPGNGGKFIKVFTLISWAFFAIVALPFWWLSSVWRF
ncbi:MAG: hypothetical protein J6U61_11715 [Lachnospiraceae bacterium]|nr:hypothetical protein [Lachnospiraceae bacterium]